MTRKEILVQSTVIGVLGVLIHMYFIHDRKMFNVPNTNRASITGINQ